MHIDELAYSTEPSSLTNVLHIDDTHEVVPMSITNPK